jgi:hypothetical protein
MPPLSQERLGVKHYIKKGVRLEQPDPFLYLFQLHYLTAAITLFTLYL